MFRFSSSECQSGDYLKHLMNLIKSSNVQIDHSQEKKYEKNILKMNKEEDIELIDLTQAVEMDIEEVEELEKITSKDMENLELKGKTENEGLSLVHKSKDCTMKKHNCFICKEGFPHVTKLLYHLVR